MFRLTRVARAETLRASHSSRPTESGQCALSRRGMHFSLLRQSIVTTKKEAARKCGHGRASDAASNAARNAPRRGDSAVVKCVRAQRSEFARGERARMAERVGFEPTKGVNPCWFSRPVHSTALPPLRESLSGCRTGHSASAVPRFQPDYPSRAVAPRVVSEPREPVAVSSSYGTFLPEEQLQ